MKKLKFFYFLFPALLLISCGGSENTYSLKTIEGHNVVVGSENGLMWYMTRDTINEAENLKRRRFSEAVSVCAGLEHAGFTDWRLPDIDELRTIVRGYGDIETGGRCAVSENCLKKVCLTKNDRGANDHSCSNMDEGPGGPGFEGCYWDKVWEENVCGEFWSSSEVIQEGPESIWLIDFSKPVLFLQSTSSANTGFVRCVREN